MATNRETDGTEGAAIRPPAPDDSLFDPPPIDGDPVIWMERWRQMVRSRYADSPDVDRMVELVGELLIAGYRRGRRDAEKAEEQWLKDMLSSQAFLGYRHPFEEILFCQSACKPTNKP